MLKGLLLLLLLLLLCKTVIIDLLHILFATLALFDVTVFESMVTKLCPCSPVRPVSTYMSPLTPGKSTSIFQKNYVDLSKNYVN